MRAFLLFLLLTFSGWALAATATSFDQLLADANAAAATDAGKAYEAELVDSIYPYLGIMLKKCSLSSGLPPQDFTLVGKVSRFQSLINVAVKPDNALTRCLGPRLSSQCYPWPPAAYLQDGYPLAINFKADMVKGVTPKQLERPVGHSCGF